MDKPYLIVRRLNQYKEPELTAVGPFASEADMILFAKGIRYANGSMDDILGRSSKPWNMFVSQPGDLFPWEGEHIQDADAEVAKVA